MAGDTRKTAAKPAKKRPGGRLTAIILLALFLGIGVQFLNMYARLQEAQEEQAAYAQRLADLQETNERLAEDIANSQDPELIEEVAREDLGMAAPVRRSSVFPTEAGRGGSCPPRLFSPPGGGRKKGAAAFRSGPGGWDIGKLPSVLYSMARPL